MDVRGKLVELVGKARRYAANKCHSFMSCAECDHCGEYDGNCRNTYIAESLIADGVTVQEWISVEDRLPEDSTTVNLYTRSRIVGTGFYDKNTKSWVQYYSGGAICVDVTNWQPMPQPPKGAAHDS